MHEEDGSVTIRDDLDALLQVRIALYGNILQHAATFLQAGHHGRTSFSSPSGRFLFGSPDISSVYAPLEKYRQEALVWVFMSCKFPQMLPMLTTPPCFVELNKLACRFFLKIFEILWDSIAIGRIC